jgi:hypothetical protein
VLALIDSPSLFRVVAKRVVGAAAEIRFKPLLDYPGFELQRAAMDAAVLWNSSVPF